MYIDDRLVKVMVIGLKEIRDNTPAIYDAKDKIYYSMLSDFIEKLEKKNTYRKL